MQARIDIEVPVDNREQSPEMDRFNDALRQVVRVSKEEFNHIRAQEKAANADKPKRGPKPLEPIYKSC
ncbi:MAG: hypothetical protein ABI197_02170 [Granulicella sp.]